MGCFMFLLTPVWWLSAVTFAGHICAFLGIICNCFITPITLEIVSQLKVLNTLFYDQVRGELMTIVTIRLVKPPNVSLLLLALFIITI